MLPFSFSFSIRRLRTMLLALSALAAAGALPTSPAAADTAGTYYVDGASTGGRCSDAYSGDQAQHPTTPWCTITRAVAQAREGSVVKVAPGVYHEEVTLTPADDGVALVGVGPTKPVIDGDWTRSTGIQLINGVNDVTINGFEIRDLTTSSEGRAVGILSLNTRNDTIENNIVHAVHAAGLWSYGIMLGTNDSPGLVHNVIVSSNRIYDIGPGGESMGIWLLMTTNMTVDQNEIYLVRKEGIRYWYGLDNRLTSNRVYLNWVGIALESAVGDYVANNVSYANVWGYNPKHVSEASALTMWHLSTDQWTKFWHNTSYANTHADIALGMNPPNEDYLDVRDNVFASPGDVHIHDFPTVRGAHLIVDGNDYSGPAPLYYSDWNVPHPRVYPTLALVQSHLGWERHGQVATPVFRDPGAGDFTFSISGMRSGVRLPDSYGTQLGARGVPAAANSWTRYPARIVATTPELSYLTPAWADDGRDDSYWWSTNYSINGSMTFDLGTAQPINTFVLDLFQHDDPRSPREYSIQVSNDNQRFTTVLAGADPDSEGSSYKYYLASAVRARYVRLNLLTSFGAPTLLFSDFGIGFLSPSAATASVHPVATRHLAHRAVRRTQRRHAGARYRDAHWLNTRPMHRDPQRDRRLRHRR
jgi:hypothetical protein